MKNLNTLSSKLTAFAAALAYETACFLAPLGYLLRAAVLPEHVQRSLSPRQSLRHQWLQLIWQPSPSPGCSPRGRCGCPASAWRTQPRTFVSRAVRPYTPHPCARPGTGRVKTRVEGGAGGARGPDGYASASCPSCGPACHIRVQVRFGQFRRDYPISRRKRHPRRHLTDFVRLLLPVSKPPHLLAAVDSSFPGGPLLLGATAPSGPPRPSSLLTASQDFDSDLPPDSLYIGVFWSFPLSVYLS